MCGAMIYVTLGYQWVKIIKKGTLVRPIPHYYNLHNCGHQEEVPSQWLVGVPFNGPLVNVVLTLHHYVHRTYLIERLPKISLEFFHEWNSLEFEQEPLRGAEKIEQTHFFNVARREVSMFSSLFSWSKNRLKSSRLYSCRALFKFLSYRCCISMY